MLKGYQLGNALQLATKERVFTFNMTEALTAHRVRTSTQVSGCILTHEGLEVWVFHKLVHTDSSRLHGNSSEADDLESRMFSLIGFCNDFVWILFFLKHGSLYFFSQGPCKYRDSNSTDRLY